MDKRKITPEVPAAQSLKNSHWRVRARSHKENVAELLRQRGEQGLGVRSSELYSRPDLYGRSPRNRISELGKAHWDIGSKRCAESDADHFYWLRSDSTGRDYPTQRFEPPQFRRPYLPESDFMRRRREEDQHAAPLFAEAQP